VGLVLALALLPKSTSSNDIDKFIELASDDVEEGPISPSLSRVV